MDEKISNPCLRVTLFALLFGGVAACSPSSQPLPGPDKQFSGELQGAMVGAGAGAATGAQLAAGTGPGILVGAGIGAVAGGIQGASEDSVEEKMLKMSSRTRYQRERAQVQEILDEHYKRRLELHPTRDIFPADLFFSGDSAKLSRQGEAIVRELANMNKRRLPWSRLAVATYVRSNADQETESADFSKYLAKKRAIELGDCFIKYGIEPRRIETRPIIMPAPILIDPHDKPGRYNQAIELIPLDR